MNNTDHPVLLVGVGSSIPASEIPEWDYLIPQGWATLQLWPEFNDAVLEPEKVYEPIRFVERSFRLENTGPNPTWPLTPNLNYWKRTQ